MSDCVQLNSKADFTDAYGYQNRADRLGIEDDVTTKKPFHFYIIEITLVA